MSTTIYRGYKIVLRGDTYETYKDGSLKGRCTDLSDARAWVDRQWAKKSTHFDRVQSQALQHGRAE